VPRDKKRITRVTTRGGDGGQTSLADGTRLAKTDPRIHAIGSVDELNSFVGLLAAELTGSGAEPHGETLARLQQELFDLGAHLATRGATPLPDAAWLDDAVARINAELPPLNEFVLPNGPRDSVLAHVCRTVCRRAERDAWEVPDATAVARYLNRLSDLLFVMARALKRADGLGEAEWRGVPEQ